jgi:hypothetical protein
MGYLHTPAHVVYPFDCAGRALQLGDHGPASRIRVTGLGSLSGSRCIATTSCRRALGSQTGSKLALRMISFNSLVALLTSCSSAATAWRSRAAQHASLQIIDTDHVLRRFLAP